MAARECGHEEAEETWEGCECVRAGGGGGAVGRQWVRECRRKRVRECTRKRVREESGNPRPADAAQATDEDGRRRKWFSSVGFQQEYSPIAQLTAGMDARGGLQTHTCGPSRWKIFTYNG